MNRNHRSGGNSDKEDTSLIMNLKISNLSGGIESLEKMPRRNKINICRVDQVTS